MFGRRGELAPELYAPYTPEPLEPDSPVYQPRGGSNSLGLEELEVSTPYAFICGVCGWRWSLISFDIKGHDLEGTYLGF